MLLIATYSLPFPEVASGKKNITNYCQFLVHDLYPQGIKDTDISTLWTGGLEGSSALVSGRKGERAQLKPYYHNQEERRRTEQGLVVAFARDLSEIVLRSDIDTVE